MKKINLTQIIVILLSIFFLVFVITRVAEIKDIIEVLKKGKWYFVLLALFLQMFDIWIFTYLYHLCFQIVGVKSKVKNMIPVMFASVFANIIPAGGTSGAALFIHDSIKRGESGTKSTIGAFLVQLFDFSAFLLVLAFGLVYLLNQNTLKVYQVVASSILVFVVGVVLTLLAVSFFENKVLKDLLALLRKIVNRIYRVFKRNKDLISEHWPEKLALEFRLATIALFNKPKLVLKTFLVALFNHVSDILTVFVLFLAFDQNLRLGIVITGFAMTNLFSIISITPQGIGVVEGVMAIMYTSLGIGPQNATVISLAYRGLKLWIPTFIGFIMLRKINSFKDSFSNGKKKENIGS